jgi:hypothetical protein
MFPGSEAFFGIAQLQAEQNREQSPDDSPYDTRDQKLLGDRFMILAEKYIWL